MSSLFSLKKTVGQVADLVGGEAQGDPSFTLENVATLQDAGPSDLSFMGNPKYAAQAERSSAGCLILPPSARGLACRAPNKVFVEDPQYAFSIVLGLIESLKPRRGEPGVHEMAFVHPQARVGARASVGPFSVIEAGAEVGADSVIGPQSYLGPNSRIGSSCRIHPQVVIREDCRVGDRVIIHSGAVIGADGFGFSPDLKTGRHRKIPQIGNVVIEDDVEIGANTTIDRAAIGSTVIGAGSKIDNLVQIAHGVRLGRDCILVSQSGVAGSTVLGNRVVLGGQAGLVGHIHVGDGAQIAAQTGVMADVEKGQILFGSPARPHREAMRLQALINKLPSIYETLKDLRSRLGAQNSPPEKE